MLDKTNGFKLLEPIGLVRIGLAAAVVVTASTTEEEKNDPDPVIAAAVIIVVATSAEAAVVIAASTAAGQKKDNPDPVTAAVVTASTSVVRNSLIASHVEYPLKGFSISYERGVKVLQMALCIHKNKTQNI